MYGVKYSESSASFVYYVWTESWIGGEWYRVDPIENRLPEGAGYLALQEAENPSANDLVAMMGRLSVRVLVLQPDV